MTQNTTGAGPPPDVEPQDLWTKLTTLPRPHKEVAFPRKDPRTGAPFTDTVAIWVLTEADLMASRASAEAYARELLASPKRLREANGERNDLAGGLGYQEVYKNACVVEVVWRACRSTLNVQVPAFPSTLLIRKYFTSDEIAVLFQAYCAWQAETGPMVSAMSKEEMDAWLDVLMEGASAVPLAALSLDARTALLLHSASRLQASRAANGSAGSPPSASSPSSSPPSNGPTASSPSSRPAPSSTVDDAERPEEPELDTP